MIRRYVALDGWRGVCACLVVLFHTEAYSHLYGAMHNFYLCVDFFFVLSGFVITASYRKKLLAGFSRRKFLALRLGRIYPLHLFMLAGFLLFYGLKVALMGNFADRSFSLDTFVGNLLLVQSLGLFQHLSWNGPSWSISVEFYTYVAFVLGLVLLRHHLWVLELAVVLAMPAVFLATGQKMNATYHLGFLRCVYGFSAGCLCYLVHTRISAQPLLRRPALLNAAEVVSIAVVVGFLYAAGPTVMSAFSPYVFGAVILVFAQEKGFVSAALSSRPSVFLGRLSYSIYMTHFLVILLVFNAAGMLSRFLGRSLRTPVLEDGREVELLGTQLWHGDLILLFVLTATILVSHFTYRFVEEPAYRWSRKLAQKLPGRTRRRVGGRPALAGRMGAPDALRHGEKQNAGVPQHPARARVG